VRSYISLRKNLSLAGTLFHSFSRLFLSNYLCTRFIYWTSCLNWVSEIVLHLKMLFQTLGILMLSCAVVLEISFSFLYNFCSLLINPVSLPTTNHSGNFRIECILFCSVGFNELHLLGCRFAITSENYSTLFVSFTT